MKKILITGGAGFVGSHLADALLEQGYHVGVFDYVTLDQTFQNTMTGKNLEHAKKHSNFKYFQGDIRDKKTLENIFSEKFQTVYHLASVVGVHKYMDDPFNLIDITVLGTRNIAELAQKHGTQILYSSTSEIFGKNPKVPWDEDDDRVLGSTSVDRWSYSASKGVCEQMLLGLHKLTNHPVTIVRYFNAYGPRQSPIFVVSQSIHRALNNQRPYLYDGGEQTRCFTFIEDVIKGTIAAATYSAGNGQVFNIGNNKEVTMKEVVELIIKHSGTNLGWEAFNTKKVYGNVYEDVPRRVPANDKAKRLLGWEPQIGHEEGIRRTINWAQNNPWWLSTHNKQSKL